MVIRNTSLDIILINSILRHLTTIGTPWLNQIIFVQRVFNLVVFLFKAIGIHNRKSDLQLTKHHSIISKHDS